MIKVSIILATYNQPIELDIILANLSPQLRYYPEVELLIADDGSGVDTQCVIDNYKGKIKNFQHIWHIDLGFRKSIILNEAVTKSRGEYLLFLDGDCIPFPDYIEQQIKLIEDGYFIAGSRILLSKNFTSEILQNHEIVQEIYCWRVFGWLMARLQKLVNKLFAYLRFNHQAKWRYWRENNWKYPKGCNFLVSRKDYMAVNGFDEVFSGWGHEDSDLFIRLLHSGVKIKDGRFAIPVLHLWHKEAPRDKVVDNYQRLITRLYDKNLIRAEQGIDKHIF